MMFHDLVDVIWNMCLGDPLLVRLFLELVRQGMCTMVITFFLDLVCYRTAKRIMKNQPKLYEESVFLNFFNHLIMTPVVFAVLGRIFLMPGSPCDTTENIAAFRKDNELVLTSEWWMHIENRPWCEPEEAFLRGAEANVGIVPSSIQVPFKTAPFGTFSGEGIFRMFIIVVVQAIGFYFIHMWMHRRENYWMHKFHHRYNADVIPMAANAVHVLEFVIAYQAPIAVGSLIAQPSFLGLLLAGHWVVLSGVLIHTPLLHDLAEKLPSCICTIVSHSEHHRLLKAHYAAPCINVDWFVAKIKRKECGLVKNYYKVGKDVPMISGTDKDESAGSEGDVSLRSRRPDRKSTMPPGSSAGIVPTLLRDHQISFKSCRQSRSCENECH